MMATFLIMAPCSAASVWERRAPCARRRPQSRSRGTQHDFDRGGEATPALRLVAQRAPARARESIVARAPVVRRFAPLALDQPAVLQPLQRRVERALIHLELAPRDLLDPLADAPAVQGRERQRLQDEKIDGAAKDFG